MRNKLPMPMYEDVAKHEKIERHAVDAGLGQRRLHGMGGQVHRRDLFERTAELADGGAHRGENID